MSTGNAAANDLLRGLLRRRALAFGVDAAIGAAFFLVGVLPGLAAKLFFDGLTTDRPSTGPLLLGGLIAVKVVHVALGMAWMHVDTRLRGGLLVLLRRNLMERLLTAPATRALSRPVGDVVSRLVEDVRAVVETLCKRAGLMNLTSSLSFTAVAVAVMAAIDVRVMLLALLPGLLVMLASYLTSERVQRQRARSRRAAGDVQSLLMDAFSGIQSVKLAGAEAGVERRLRQLNDRRRSAAVRDNVLSVLLRSLSATALALGTALILFAVVGPIRRGEFTIGDLAICLYLLAEVGIGVTVTGQFLSSWRQAQASAGRLAELLHGAPPAALLDPPTRVGAGEDGPLEVLRVRDLACDHPDGSPALRAVSFDLHAGEVLVVAGKVGAGKSTLLQCLLGMTPAAGGRVCWNDTVVTDPARFFVPPRCAYTAQVPHVFSGTVRDNIFLGRRYTPDEETAAVSAAVLEHDLAQLPDGAQTEVGLRGHRLSGGQVQRLAVARMAAQRTELSVIDDMSSVLDARTEAELWRRHAERPAVRRTALVVSNRRSALRNADRILVLAGGRIVADGPLTELLRTSPDLRELWSAG